MRSSYIFLLLLFTACSSIPRPLSMEKTREYLKKENGMKKVVDYLSHQNMKHNKVIGMVVAVIMPGKDPQYFSYGYRDKERSLPMSDDAIFQIGSITKIFTASLLPILEEENILKLNDPIRKYVRKFRPKTKWVKHITLSEMASHTSGFPPEYQNFTFLNRAVTFLWTGNNIWQDLKERQMWYFIENFNFGPKERTRYHYSNVGYVVLGGLLNKLVPGKSYSQLIADKITIPLELKDTVFELNKEQEKRLAVGYSGDAPPLMKRHLPMEPWSFDAGLRAAGGLYSSAPDMVKFIKVQMNDTATPLSPTLRKAHVKVAPTRSGSVGLGWFVEKLLDSGDEQTYVNGIISGYTSYIGYEEKSQIGVIVFQNTMNMNYEFGEKLLDRLVLSQK